MIGDPEHTEHTHRTTPEWPSTVSTVGWPALQRQLLAARCLTMGVLTQTFTNLVRDALCQQAG